MKLPSFIYVLLFLSFQGVFGQTDSLATKSFEELEQRYLATYTNPKEAKKYVDALCIVAKKGSNKQRIAKALYRKGNVYLRLGDTKSALEFTDESMANKPADDKKLLLQNLVQKGNIFFKEGTYNSAIHFYLKAKVIAESMKSTTYVLVMSTNIALTKKQIEEYASAIVDFKQNLKVIKELNSASYTALEIKNNLGLGDTYLRIQQPDSALIYTSNGLAKTSLETHPALYTDLLFNKIIIYYQKKQYQQCIANAVSLDSLVTKTGQAKKFITSYLYKAKSYQALKNIDSAIIQYEKFTHLATTEDFTSPELEEVYYQLAKMYLEKKDIKTATENFELFEKFTQQKDSLNIHAQNTIKDHDISSLRDALQKVTDEKNQQKKTVNYLYIISLVFVGLAILLFLLFNRSKKKNKKRFEELLVQIQQLESQKKKPKETLQKTDLSINDEGVAQILKDLEKFEAKQLFLHVDCTLASVAKKLKTNTSYLSHVVNTYKGKKFTAYLNELRINTALITLKNDKKIRLYSIKAIANEFGYARRETFSKVFKNATGMDPTSYIKALQLQDKNNGDNS
ncbi:helix-turn-helix domain-containing protein [uncultured Kordia sp.]|uniref:helix-turn-helix domain-containing protein n=1 Tax=uncultured Kordia sp. TaxID=507699 RepID=UPI00260699F8|nr:helix-turn-helix domain-containing protein [uncultured Kordia sp.]